MSLPCECAVASPVLPAEGRILCKLWRLSPTPECPGLYTHLSPRLLLFSSRARVALFCRGSIAALYRRPLFSRHGRCALVCLCLCFCLSLTLPSLFAFLGCCCCCCCCYCCCCWRFRESPLQLRQEHTRELDELVKQAGASGGLGGVGAREMVGELNERINILMAENTVMADQVHADITPL